MNVVLPYQNMWDMWENAHGFIGGGLVKQVNRLAGSPQLSSDERQALLGLSSALAAMPSIDPSYLFQIEIDFSWDDLNWVGRLDLNECEFSLWSTMHQIEGSQSEQCAQWQHTAFELRQNPNEATVLKYDPSHLWLWIRYFRKFVDKFLEGIDPKAFGEMVCSSLYDQFSLQATTTQAAGDSE